MEIPTPTRTTTTDEVVFLPALPPPPPPPPRIFQIKVQPIMSDSLEFGIPVFPEAEAKMLVAASPVLKSCAFDFLERVFHVEVLIGDTRVMSVMLDPVEFMNFSLVNLFFREFWARHPSNVSLSSQPIRMNITSSVEAIMSRSLLRSLVSGLNLTYYNFASTPNDTRAQARPVSTTSSSEVLTSRMRTLPRVPLQVLLDIKVYVPKALPRVGDRPVTRLPCILLLQHADREKLCISVERLPPFLRVSDDQTSDSEWPLYFSERCRCFVHLQSDDVKRLHRAARMNQIGSSIPTMLLFENVRKGHLCVAYFERLDAFSEAVSDGAHVQTGTLESALDNAFCSETSDRIPYTHGLIRIRIV